MKGTARCMIVLGAVACAALVGCRGGEGNHAPVAEPQFLSTPQDTPLDITLTATDEDPGDELAWHIDAQPTHGELAGAEPELTYTPAAGYTGSDLFTFHASDRYADSEVAAVSIYVGVPLAVASTMPEDGELDVAVDAVVSVTFDEEIDQSSVTTSTFLLEDEEGDPVTGAVSVSGSTATFTPDAALMSRPYMATVTAGVRDIFGRSLAQDYSFGFTTVLYGEPVSVASGAQDCVDPRVAADASGMAIAVWVARQGEHIYTYDSGEDVYAYGGIWASVYTPGEGWATAEEISSSSDASSPQVAFYDDGAAVFVWEQDWDPTYGLWLAIRRRLYGASGWAAADEPVSEASAGVTVKDPMVAVDPAGWAFLFWEQRQDDDQQSIWVQRTQLIPDSETPVEVTWDFANFYGYAEGGRIAFDSAGNAMLVWYTDYNDGLADYRVIRSRRHLGDLLGWEGGARSPVFADLSAVGVFAERPQIGSDPDGNYVVVWQQADVAEGVLEAYAASWVSGSWDTPIKLSDAASSSSTAYEPMFAMSADSSAVAVWAEMALDESGETVLASRYASGSWEAPEQIYSPLSGFAMPVAMVMDSAGRAHVLCAGFDMVSSTVVARLMGLTYDAGWQTIGQLSAAAPFDSETGAPALCVAPDGYAIAVCPVTEGTYYSILANRYGY